MDITTPSPEPEILIDGANVYVISLDFTDRAVASYLESLPEEQRAPALVRAIGIGVHGLSATTMRATVEEMQHEVHRIIAGATEAAESQLDEAMESGRARLAAHLDPEVRSSLTARTVAELSALHEATLEQLDPNRTDSHTAQLVSAITDLLGPDGLLAERLASALDLDATDNGLGRLLEAFERRFQEIRDLVVGDQQRKDEAERGTAKGMDFEETLEHVLRTEARAMSGCIVERTGQSPGSLGTHAKVGDFTFALSDGIRIAIEAKNTGRIGLTGGTGILTELDNAMDNRNADWAICISSTDAYPAEVGSFGVYGNRILVVDPGDGVLTRVALRWVAAAARASRATDERVDSAAAIERLDRIRDLAQHFSRSKKALAGAQSGLESVREELDSMRRQLLDLVDDATRALHPTSSPAKRVA